MLFAFWCRDRADALAIRMENRPAHLAWLESLGARVVTAGPTLDGQGNPDGSLLVIDCADEAAADALAASDPYALAGLFENVDIRPWKQVFPKNGA